MNGRQKSEIINADSTPLTHRPHRIAFLGCTHDMTNSQRLAMVRDCLKCWLKDQDTYKENDESILRETILIRNEFFCGRQFHLRNHHAIWFIEEDELKIYGPDRELAATFDSQQISAAGEVEPKILRLPEPIQASERRRAA